MEKTNRFFGLSLCVSALFGLLAGCTNTYDKSSSSSQTNEDGKTTLEEIMEKYDSLPYEYEGDACTITMCHWDGIGTTIERQVIQAMLQGFKLRYPKIDVELEILSDYESTYPSRLAAGNVHDVFLMPDGSFNAWAKTNTCLNLDQFIDASELIDMDEMYDTSLVRYRYDLKNAKPSSSGNQLALPKDIGPTVMYYNKAAFDQAGVNYPDPNTILSCDDATELWKSVTMKDKNGNVTRYGISGLSIEGLVWSAGGDFLNPERTAFPTDPSTIAGLKRGYQYIQDAYVTNFITPPVEFTAGSDGAMLFSQQRVACYIGLKANVTSFRELSFDWDICPVPAFEVNPGANAWSGSVGYSVYNKSKNIEAAWKLVEYIASREGQELLSATGFQIPCYPDLGYDERYLTREKENKPKNVEVFLSSAETQPAGLWCYRDTQTWKTQGYDATSELLMSSDPSKRIAVDEFLAEAKAKVNGSL
ncbi:MAG TPA: extracellular solute-binding protein [Erysipelotrichaceae bacterium]|nr:extracellular solute-binding protein [Erysipelotrichaceae bacterium]